VFVATKLQKIVGKIDRRGDRKNILHGWKLRKMRRGRKIFFDPAAEHDRCTPAGLPEFFPRGQCVFAACLHDLIREIFHCHRTPLANPSIAGILACNQPYSHSMAIAAELLARLAFLSPPASDPHRKSEGWLFRLCLVRSPGA